MYSPNHAPVYSVHQCMHHEHRCRFSIKRKRLTIHRNCISNVIHLDALRWFIIYSNWSCSHVLYTQATQKFHISLILLLCITFLMIFERIYGHFVHYLPLALKPWTFWIGSFAFDGPLLWSSAKILLFLFFSKNNFNSDVFIDFHRRKISCIP